MKWNTLKYLFKEGIISLWKNRIMALASAGTIVLCLLILGVSYALGSNIDTILKQVETKFGITAYVKDGVEEQRILTIQQELNNIPHITHIEYISKEEALKIFSDDSESDTLFEDFQKDNPLPASFELTVESIEFQDQVAESLKKYSELEIVYLQKETDIFMKLNHTVNYVSWGISVCLIIIGLLLMANTIKLTVYIRRKEINIMKYIGATDWFIRLPFLIEGIVIGFIGSLVSIVCIILLYNSVHEFMITHLLSLLNGFHLLEVKEIMRELIPIYLSIGIGIGLIGSGVSVHKHLKV
ncbi:permease-like cell division protein FtsX [Sporanaerobium hydrogeniformans]|uniref:permease-like cell division protein FtsX n=1 Tax=Sporanaerobium hydrogeniformans TaxID=3072179 RepID=UPI0015D4ECA5|nr:permease-like cell division protein FtsX [Sporanaerobium hydrogeniformans]